MFTKEDITTAFEILSAYSKDLRDMGYNQKNHDICISLLEERCSEELANLIIPNLYYFE